MMAKRLSIRKFSFHLVTTNGKASLVSSRSFKSGKKATQGNKLPAKA